MGTFELTSRLKRKHYKHLKEEFQEAIPFFILFTFR